MTKLNNVQYRTVGLDSKKWLEDKRQRVTIANEITCSEGAKQQLNFSALCEPSPSFVAPCTQRWLA